MNYVNRQAAEALKDAGFDVPVVAYYLVTALDCHFLFHKHLLDHNTKPDHFSAPDFLTAADWIDLKSEGYIQLSFWKTSTVVYNDAIGEHSKVFQIGDHRNAAIIYALQELKAERCKQ